MAKSMGSQKRPSKRGQKKMTSSKASTKGSPSKGAANSMSHEKGMC